MKLLLLNVLAAAITCSSLNFTAQSRVNDNIKQPILQATRKARYDTENLPLFYDVDGPQSTGWRTDSIPECANKIGYSRGKIEGTIFSNQHNWFGTTYIDYMDEDWFVFTVPQKSDYYFKIDSPDRRINFEVYRYIGLDRYSYDCNSPAYVWASTRGTRQTYGKILPPGTYFFCVFSDEARVIDGFDDYTITYSSNVTEDYSINIANYADQYSTGYEVFVWENDLVPFNVNRWEDDSKHLFLGGPYSGAYSEGYLDPIFTEGFNTFMEHEYNSIDSILYIFDKAAIKEIYDNCSRLMKYLEDLIKYNNQVAYKDKVLGLKIDDGVSVFLDIVGVVAFVASIVAYCVPGAQVLGVGLSGLSLVLSSPCLISTARDMISLFSKVGDDSPENLGYFYNNLTVLHDNCNRALQDPTGNTGIKLPRFSNIYDAWDDTPERDDVYWSASSFQKLELSEGPDGYYNAYLAYKNTDLDSSFDYVNINDETIHCRGEISYFKDMNDFSSKTNFSFGQDITQGQGVEYQQVLTNVVKSVELSGNYKKVFMAGDQFSTEGMKATVKFTNQSTRQIPLNYTPGSTAPNCLSVDLSRVNMNAEGRYPVLIKYTQTLFNPTDTYHVYPYYITKYAKYYIDVRFERDTLVDCTYFEISGRDLSYWPGGHGMDACYYINTHITIPVSPSEMESVTYLGCQIENGDPLQVNTETILFYPDGDVISVHIETKVGVGRESICLVYSYETIVPFEPKPDLESISITSPAKNKFKVAQEQFSTAGLGVTASYSDGTTADVTEDCTIDTNSVNMSMIGTYPVHVSYTERNITKTITYYIEVAFAHLESITLAGDYQTVFGLGEPFNSDNLVVYANNSFGESVLLNSNQYQLDSSRYNSNCPGTYRIEVSYFENGRTEYKSYSVEVLVPELESVEFSGNYSTTFEVGDAFNYNGLRLLATYVNGYSTEITNFTVDSSNVDMSEAGFYEVFVSYEIYGVTGTLSYFVDVDEVCLESITLSGVYQKSFTIGDEFNFDGLIVTANYSNGTSHQVFDYIVDSAAVDMSTAGRYTIYVSYSEGGIEVSSSYVVRVKPVKVDQASLQSITLSGFYPTLFARGSEFTYDGLIVTANYSDGTSGLVTNFTVDSSLVNMNKAGSYPVIVSYTENGVTVSATYTVTVLKLIIRPIFDDDPIPFPGGKF